jgi:hypothetical protein
VDPDRPIRFAIDLFDVNESTIAPGSAQAIAALGSGGPAPSAGASAPASGSPTPGVSPGPSTGGGGATDRRPARDELWVPIVLLVLAVLTLEYALYQRDAVIRYWRMLSVRLGRTPGGSG